MAQAFHDQHYDVTTPNDTNSSAESLTHAKPKVRQKNKDLSISSKRRCVSTACIACRRRKSKCDGNTPSCAACSSVYGTDCVYDPNSDHRRKGVYKQDIDNLKTRNSTLQTLIHAILNYPESDVPNLIRQIRTCESLDDVAESIQSKAKGLDADRYDSESPLNEDDTLSSIRQFETELSGKMGELRLENGSVSFIGGTSNLLYLDSKCGGEDVMTSTDGYLQYQRQEDAVVSWTEVTSDPDLVIHLIHLYFTWHYTYFTTLSKNLFYRDFVMGKPTHGTKRNEYCTSLLVNAMLALGCHFTSWPTARMDSRNPATAGDHFFKEAKRLILENDEHENPRLATVQALALMSVREAGCGREAKGWVYSGMSFRMAYDLGLNVESGRSIRDDLEIDARRVTIWGCFLFDKCWSNYLGRQPQLPLSSMGVPKIDVFPTEEADTWSPYVDSGIGQAHSQPSRTRAVALQISVLCEISCDVLLSFYDLTQAEKLVGKQAELKKLSELHPRLEKWQKNLPKEMEAKEGQLPHVLVMHMFFHLLYIHLFRPFLKYKQTNSPLPSHISPRKFCTQAAAMISKLLRIYKKTYGLRQICNIVVYIAHSACTIHLLNLPDKNAVRDIIHGVKHLEEIAESWLCARRALSILHYVARRWKTELPEEAAKVLSRNAGTVGNSKHDHEFPRTGTRLSVLTQSDNPTPTASIDQPLFAFRKDDYLNNIKGDVRPIVTTMYNGTDGSVSVPLQSDAVLGHISQQQPYVMSQAQQELWSQDQASRGSFTQTQTSPSVLFGGVESLVEESQDWWLKDQANFFHSWYGPEHEVLLVQNGVANEMRTLEYGDGPRAESVRNNLYPASTVP